MTDKKRQHTGGSNLPRPQNVGIKGIQIYIPNEYVNQQELEKFDGIPAGKYTIGLGQTNMSFVNDREDIYSMSLTVCSKLIESYNIDINNIGRLEVGTETLLDKSKSVKSVLMQLFESSGNTDIEGIDTINACYGGTNAIFNSINWLESNAWDGRDAIVVCGDIAIYDKGAARPTGGAGAVALWIGPDAPIIFDSIRGSYMENAYDFYKPDFTSEYPYVDGHYSLQCYVKSVDKVYESYRNKAIKFGFLDNNKPLTEYFDFNVFHVPTCKLVQKSYGRILFNDYKSKLINDNNDTDINNFLNEDYEKTLSDKLLEKKFVNISKDLYKRKVLPSITVPTNTGNMYTASLYASLASLLTYVNNDDLLNKRIGLFSYGSGLAASLFSIKIVGDISLISNNLDIQNKLNNRIQRTPDEYNSALVLREAAHLKKDFIPSGEIDHLQNGTYYLVKIDDRFRREYNIKK